MRLALAMILLAWLGASGVRAAAPVNRPTPVRTVSPGGLPTNEVVLREDDLEIAESCLLEIAPGHIVTDANSNGVIRVTADNIKIRFTANSILRGAPDGTPGNTLIGIGIRIDGHTNVVIENARVRGFKNGLYATEADGLMLSGGDFSDNYRQHLKSTMEQESAEDWIFPHRNDEVKWREQYGGAVCIERSARVTLRKIKVRRTQNGILLDRVTDSAIYDNDCSYLSGWGIALWMSSRNRIERNACDFCVRGHFEDFYNRGQDSAGILCFEQSNENLFIENSATHGGDGFFGFAGHAAIGETWWKRETERLRKETGKEKVDDLIVVPEALARVTSDLGCNGNLLLGNDFSYASAHGIELTFSEDNKILRNRIVENGICGIWGGYSSRTLIAENEIERNGGLSHGQERGGINMEHAADNLILKNKFINNKVGVYLWWDDDGVLMRFPGVAGNERGIVGNLIAGNLFEVNGDLNFKGLRSTAKLPALHMRDPSQTRIRDNHFYKNTVKLGHPFASYYEMADRAEIMTEAKVAIPHYTIPKITPLGSTHPVGSRRHLRDRRYIVMDEWGPKEYD